MAVNSALPAYAFWRGKRVLLTGHTGFKGAWLALWLNRMGAKVIGISLAPVTSPNLFTQAGIDASVGSHFHDIRDMAGTAALISQANPDVVFHLAAQALVRASYRSPTDTFATNVLGTAHVLEAVRTMASVRAVVAVTTDKVYHNHEHWYPYRESDALGGRDPYSASKAAAEMVIASYRDSFLAGQGVAVASARAGNVIGGGDWSEDRLIPDAVRAWTANHVLRVRRPDAIRPWQHVLEPVAAYLRLAQQIWEHPNLAAAYNFGPETNEAATVREVIELARGAYSRGEVEWGDGSEGPHEAGSLALEIAKARTELGVRPLWSLTTAVTRTMDWYRRQCDGEDARALCEADIRHYESGSAVG